MDRKKGISDFTENIVPVSELARGRAKEIFANVKDNQEEYLVLKNSSPQAFIVPVEVYKGQKNQLERLAVMRKRINELIANKGDDPLAQELAELVNEFEDRGEGKE